MCFSKNKRRRKATIVPLKPGVTIGQRDMLSKTDCMKLNSQYNCFPQDLEQVRKIQIICGMVGVWNLIKYKLKVYVGCLPSQFYKNLKLNAKWLKWFLFSVMTCGFMGPLSLSHNVLYINKYKQTNAVFLWNIFA